MEKHFFYGADNFLSRGEKLTKSEETSAWHYLNLSWANFVSMSSNLKTVHKRHKRDTTYRPQDLWQTINYILSFARMYNRRSYLIISVTSLRRRGHFRVPKSLTFKTRLSENLSHENESFLLIMESHLSSLWSRGLGQRGNFCDLFRWPRILEEKMRRLLSVNFRNVERITARTSPLFTQWRVERSLYPISHFKLSWSRLVDALSKASWTV